MKTVIYKVNDTYYTTNEKNYNSTVQNARQIHKMQDFTTAQDIKEYYIKYFGCTENDFIIVNE